MFLVLPQLLLGQCNQLRSGEIERCRYLQYGIASFVTAWNVAFYGLVSRRADCKISFWMRLRR